MHPRNRKNLPGTSLKNLPISAFERLAVYPDP
jgi:hypothetical protein